jgi:hypothetical protein
VDHNYETLIEQVKILSTTVWDQKADELSVLRWLDNFKTEDDQLTALYLLSRFLYFGRRETREALKALYRDLIQYPIIEQIRRDHNDTTDWDMVDHAYKQQLTQTAILGVGNPSESGYHILYYFRQENRLKKSMFRNPHELFQWQVDQTDGDRLSDSALSRFLFVDDFCGTGEQAETYASDIVARIKKCQPKAFTGYYCLVGTSAGLQRLRENSDFDTVDCLLELDESFECFSDHSRYFSTSEISEREAALALAKKYGKQTWKKHPLGKDASQLMLGFPHNTPNNTLPIFWYDNPSVPWRAIFTRHSKLS